MIGPTSVPLHRRTHDPAPPARRPGCLAALAVAVLPSAFAADGSFQPNCRGSAKLGESRADGEIDYKFACGTNIAGYSIIALNRSVDAFDTEPVVLTPAGERCRARTSAARARSPAWASAAAGSATAWNQVNGGVHISTDPVRARGGRASR